MRNHPRRKDQLPVVYSGPYIPRTIYHPTPYEARLAWNILYLRNRIADLEYMLSQEKQISENLYREMKLYEPSYKRELASQQNALNQNRYLPNANFCPAILGF